MGSLIFNNLTVEKLLKIFLAYLKYQIIFIYPTFVLLRLLTYYIQLILL